MFFGTAAGVLFGSIALVALVGTLPAAALADRAGRRWAILPSAAAESASLLLMAAAGARFCLNDHHSSHVTVMNRAHILPSAAAEAASLLPMAAAGAPLQCRMLRPQGIGG